MLRPRALEIAVGPHVEGSMSIASIPWRLDVIADH